MTMRAATPALPGAEQFDSPRLLLRDGTVADVHVADATDRAALRRFFDELSPEAQRSRFFTASRAADAVIDRMVDSGDARQACTLVVTRFRTDDVRPIAVASYVAIDAATAEVAFAVSDAYQGLGLASQLLDRLAARAVRCGFERFRASTLVDNVPMLEVFRDSGFTIRATTSAGIVDLQLVLTPSADGVRTAEERDRIATARSLSPLLAPQSVAIIGVSRSRGNIGRRILGAIRDGGFAGQLWAVHPTCDEIDGVPCCRTARALPHGVDLAVIAVPAAAVLGVVDECAASGVRSLVIISAGFAEAGDAGRVLQDALVQRVRNHGMRLVGPNCLGLLNTARDVRLNASFSPVMPASGRIGLLSQSGALGIVILQLATDRKIGVSSFVSVGNKADVSSNDLLQYWESDAQTSVVLLYLESFGNPRRFARIARRVSRSKPIVALKAGRTHAGSRAAGSHTAALAADDVAVSALLHQSGVIRADTIDEMFDLAACLDTQSLPRGRRVAIVTNAGGPGILAVDACESAGLDVPELAPSTHDALASFLPPMATLSNPVDMIASAGAAEYRRAVETLLTASEVDAVIVMFTPIDRGVSAEIEAAIRSGVAAARAAGATDKPVLACVMGEPAGPVSADAGEPRDAAPTGASASAERVPRFTSPDQAARALGKIVAYSEWRRAAPTLPWTFDDLRVAEARELCRTVIAARGDGWLTAGETGRLFDAFGLPLVDYVLVRSADDAAASAARLGYPVVAKLQSRRLLHKSDAAAVHVGLSSELAVRQSFEYLTDVARSLGVDASSPDEGVVVQPMIAGGIELMVGVTNDPQFGPLVGFGLGGVHVEVLNDVHFRAAPLTDRDVDELLGESRASKLLQGYRKQPPADVASLRDLLFRVSCLASEVPELRELDLNPVLALPAGRGCRIVDARVRVAAEPSLRRVAPSPSAQACALPVR